MPIYEYLCKNCLKSCEIFQKFDDPTPKRMEGCSRNDCVVEKQISKSSFLVKSPNIMGQVAQKLTDQGNSPFQEDSGKTDGHICSSGCAMHSRNI